VLSVAGQASGDQDPQHRGNQEDEAEDQCWQGDNRIKALYTQGMAAVTYARISRDKTGAGLGVERQAADCRDLALKLGLGEPELLTDNDLSAYSGKRRPGYEQLKEGLRDGRWTTLLIWHVDRLCRSVRDLEDIVDLVNGKVAVHTVKGGEIDLETPEGRLQARMLGTLARYESEHRSDRVRRAMRQNADRGDDHGGRRKYGWNADGALELAEANIIAELTRRIVGGESCRSLAADLRARGVPSARGAAWSAYAVRQITLRARNAGLREYDGTVTAKGSWPAIVTREEWEAAKALLTDPARRVNPGNAPARLLSGLMTCGVCGLPVRSGGGGVKGSAAYRCTGNGHVKRSAALVDGVVEAYILALLEREGVGAPTPAAVPGDFHGQADALRLRLEQLEDKYSDGDLTRAGYLRNRDRLAAKLADLERKEALAIVPGPLEGVTPERWAALPLERRRAVISYLVDVKLLPLPNKRHDKADPELIEITPKRRGR
jgi:site-specific DNA recombinase